MKTGAEYQSSLEDDRHVVFQGKRIEVSTHPAMSHALHAASATYDRFHRSDPGTTNPLFDVPRSPDDLRQQVELVRDSDVLGSVTYQSLFSLLTAAPAVSQADPVYGERIHSYYEHVIAEDLRVTECITDAKGDRSLAPGAQHDPDAYVHVVDRRPDGVIVRGAKLHITGAPLCHHLLVMPTKHMKPGEEEYAISCAIPVDSPGVKIVATTFDPWPRDERDFVFSCHDSMPDGFVILDDVFVPHERVFLDGATQYSSNFAHALGLWERLGGTALMADEADTIVGLAQLVADVNGLSSIPHVREKISELIIYATLIRGGLEAAIYQHGTTEDGMVYPSELYTNAAKFYGAANYSAMTRHLHDIAGGIVATAPSSADLDDPEVGPLLRKYLQGSPSFSADDRVRIMRAVKDFTADTFGGWRYVTNLQSGGGLFAQRLVTRKHYDMASTLSRTRKLIGLTDT